MSAEGINGQITLVWGRDKVLEPLRADKVLRLLVGFKRRRNRVRYSRIDRRRNRVRCSWKADRVQLFFINL